MQNCWDVSKEKAEISMQIFKQTIFTGELQVKSRKTL